MEKRCASKNAADETNGHIFDARRHSAFWRDA
jgi:hypothetical protein